MDKILITGATGHLSKSVIEQLLKNTDATKIAAFVRDESKATFLKEKGIELRKGSYEDNTSLEKALEGINKVLLISSSSLSDRFQQHKNVVDTAVKTKVKQIVFTSVSFNDFNTSAVKEVIEPLLQTENYIKESGLVYTFLRNTLYADAIQDFVGQNVFETGIYLPTGDGKVPFALRRELGEAAANVLLNDGHENKTYQLTGKELYSFEDVAKELTSLSQKTVGYFNPDISTYAETLKSFGIPENFISFLSGFATDTKNHQYETVSADLENLLGRKPLSLRESLKELYNL